MSTTTVQKASTLNAVSAMLTQNREQIAMALPKHLTPERMIRIALTAVSTTPKLQECDPRSICGAVVEASILGLEPNGVLGEAYLIPFWNGRAKRNEAKLMVGYQGLVKLAYNTGELSGLAVSVIHAGDEFNLISGMRPDYSHRYHHLTTEQRGPVIGYLAGVELRGGMRFIEYWTVEQICAHRDKFSLSKDRGPWVDHFDSMAKKTVLRAALKYVPKSVQLQRATQLDEYAEAGLPQTWSADVPSIFQPEPELPAIDMPEATTTA